MDYLSSIFKYVNDLSEKGFEKQRKYYKYYYDGLLSEDKNIEILDIGCGTGHFLYFLEKEGYKKYFGIDISKEQIEYCKNNISKNVEAIDGFDFLKNNNKKFDLIVLNDVLEHIKKERLFEFLDLIRGSLSDGGKLLIKVPNMANPFGLQSRYADITHDIGFTELSLREALMMSIFEDVKVRGASYPVISFQSFIGRIAVKIIQIVLRFLLRIQGYNSANVLDKHLIASASTEKNN